MAEEINKDVIDGNETNTEKEVESKTYTADEIQALLQSETDKRVTEALKKQQKKYEQKISLSNLDGAEREKAEKDNTILELKEQLAQFQIEKNRSELKSVLSSRGLSAEFADILSITDDIEESQSRIDMLDKLFKASVRAEVEKRLAGSTPKVSTPNEDIYTKDSVGKMSLAELQKLAETKPEIYKKFF